MENPTEDFNETTWASLKKDLKTKVGESAYNNWLKYLNYVSVENDTITFSLPTKFLRDWIVNNYSDKIKIESKNIQITLML